MATITVQASGTSTPNDWTLEAGASKQVAVNQPDDDATTYIQSGTTSGTAQWFNCSPALSVGDVITAVTVYVRAKRGGASDCNFIMGYEFQIQGGGTRSGESAGGSLTATTNYADYSYNDTAPNDAFGSAFKFHIRNTQARNLHVTTLYVEIVYTPAAQTLTGATIASGTTLYAGTVSQAGLGLVGAHISATTTMYAGVVVPGGVALTGATIAAGTTFYAGALKLRLTGATIASGTTLYGGVLAGAATTLTGVHIAATTAQYGGMLHWGTVRIANVTTFAQADVSSASFEHETPAGDNRLLVVVATYYDPSGSIAAQWGSAGTGNGQFDSPRSIAVAADGSVYVADTLNDRIQKFNADGAYVTKWGTTGTGNGQFDTPQGVAVGPDGSVYVADTGNNRVQKFTSAGAYTTKWGSVGTGDGQFDYPSDIAVAPDSTVYVADYNNGRIQVFSASGVFADKWEEVIPTFFGDRVGLAVDFDGIVYLAGGDMNGPTVQKFDTDGNLIDSWWNLTDSHGGSYFSPAVTVDETGAVYLIEANSSLIQKRSAGGELLAEWGWGSTLFGNTFDIAIAPNGRLYVLSSDNKVFALDGNLWVNTASYNGEEMETGAGLDIGNHFLSFYTLDNPPVGTYSVALVSPSEPHAFSIHAISFSGVQPGPKDYATTISKAEIETSTTALQIDHDRTYPTNTLSFWALLYETGGTTLSTANGNHVWLETAVGTLETVLGFRAVPSRTTGSITFGATASPAVTPLITGVLHLEGVRWALAGTAWEKTTALYGGALSIGQPLLGAHISGTALYAGGVMRHLPGATIAATTALHAGSVGHGLAGATIAATTLHAGGVTVGVFAMTGAAWESAAVVHAGAVVAGGITIAGAVIVNGMTLYSGTAAAGPVVLEGRHIVAPILLYAGARVVSVYPLTGATITATALYAGVVTNHSYLIGVFIGMENPIAISGPAFIDIATLYAGMLAMRLYGAAGIGAATQVFAGAVSTGARTQTGAVYPGVVSHV